MHCICGQYLIYSDSRSKFHKPRLDAISIPDYVTKKGPTRGARHGKTEVQRKYHMAWNAWKRCCEKVDSQGELFFRYSRSISQRSSLSWITTTEQKCKELDELAKEDHTYRLTPEEKKRYQGQWYLSLNKSGKNGPMKLRSDFRAAVLMKKRLHHESGEQHEEPLSPEQYSIWHPSYPPKPHMDTQSRGNRGSEDDQRWDKHSRGLVKTFSLIKKFLVAKMLISHVSIVLVRLTSHQTWVSWSQTSNVFFHWEGFHVNSS